MPAGTDICRGRNMEHEGRNVIYCRGKNMRHEGRNVV